MSKSYKFVVRQLYAHLLKLDIFLLELLYVRITDLFCLFYCLSVELLQKVLDLYEFLES